MNDTSNSNKVKKDIFTGGINSQQTVTFVKVDNIKLAKEDLQHSIKVLKSVTSQAGGSGYVPPTPEEKKNTKINKNHKNIKIHKNDKNIKI